MSAFAGIAEAQTLEGVFDVHAHAHPDTTLCLEGAFQRNA